MGSYDGAEVCELVGLFLLNDLSNLIGKNNVGLYRDDGLAVIDNASGPQMDKIRKQMHDIFKKHNLSITTEINLSATDFLDVSFNLSQNTYFPFRKPGNKPLYINSKSNHQPTIIKQLPSMINKRLNQLSCNQEEFEKAKQSYSQALKASGYDGKLKYEERKPPKRTRKRKIIWFNPLYSMNVKTNIGKKFLNLIGRHFPKDHKYHKLFNRNTIKISYSCMNNMADRIKGYTNKILKQQQQQQQHSSTEQQQQTCNCRQKSECPLNGNCLESGLVYQATIETDDTTQKYIGLAEGDFKTRYRNHTKSLNHKKYKMETELSKLVWSLKDKRKSYSIKWKIIAKASAYRCGTRGCDLCTTEKMLIAIADDTCINKRDEFVSRGRHRRKYKLSSVKP